MVRDLDEVLRFGSGRGSVFLRGTTVLESSLYMVFGDVNGSAGYSFLFCFLYTL